MDYDPSLMCSPKPEPYDRAKSQCRRLHKGTLPCRSCLAVYGASEPQEAVAGTTLLRSVKALAEAGLKGPSPYHTLTHILKLLEGA